MTSVLPALPVLLPLLAACAAVAGLRGAPMRLLAVGALTAVLAASATLLVRSDAHGPVVLHAGGWPPPLGIALVADRLSALLLTVSVLVALAVLLFAIGQGITEDRPGTAAVLHPAYQVLVAGIALAYLSGDLFNLFVAFEVMLGASYVLITMDGGALRTQAGMTYTVVSLTSSLLLLTTTALLYAATGTVTLAQLTERVAGLPEGLRGALGLLLLTVFGIKAAVVPLHFWLPDSYPTAPAPITAVFAALLTKVGMYALLRTQTLVFPREGVWPLLAVVAITTMLTGILGAIAQDDVNRLLSFALVSHIGFMLFGLALFDVPGLTGTLLYMVHHILVQAALFLAAALAVRQTGTTALHRMRARAGPAASVAALFGLAAMSLAGVPPFSGFVAKLALLRAGAESGGAGYALSGAALLTSLLTLYAMVKIWNAAFGTGPPLQGDSALAGPAPAPGHARPTRSPRRRGSLLMLGTTAGMALTGVLVAVLAEPLTRVGEQAAEDLLRPEAYRNAVLPGEDG
ncbi:Na+/H+ antiporter subunit D [Streptomyces sp. JJ38]|uniref:Na+/H+ antiporter subunit D n=1 Tax=Streptomyces sp. JJ38 TaxID=2738128 RepID=UPI001C55F463|nr:Na+/H+ antiporter subunit D [Streptomyces sp. JJ38]MBW1599771.1 Na+/H+ antiporter subunit D [Streptomyces sp. JJ38]